MSIPFLIFSLRGIQISSVICAKHVFAAFENDQPSAADIRRLAVYARDERGDVAAFTAVAAGKDRVKADCGKIAAARRAAQHKMIDNSALGGREPQLIPRAVKLSVAANKLTDPLPHSLFFYILQKFKQLRIERIVKPEHI